jgi:hypothetical protein
LGFICIISDVNLKVSLDHIIVYVAIMNSRIDVVYMIMLLNNNRISLSIPLLRLPLISIIILPQILKIRLHLIHLVHQIYLMVNVILS